MNMLNSLIYNHLAQEHLNTCVDQTEENITNEITLEHVKTPTSMDK